MFYLLIISFLFAFGCHASNITKAQIQKFGNQPPKIIFECIDEPETLENYFKQSLQLRSIQLASVRRVGEIYQVAFMDEERNVDAYLKVYDPDRKYEKFFGIEHKINEMITINSEAAMYGLAMPIIAGGTVSINATDYDFTLVLAADSISDLKNMKKSAGFNLETYCHARELYKRLLEHNIKHLDFFENIIWHQGSLYAIDFDMAKHSNESSLYSFSLFPNITLEECKNFNYISFEVAKGCDLFFEVYKAVFYAIVITVSLNTCFEKMKALH